VKPVRIMRERERGRERESENLTAH